MYKNHITKVDEHRIVELAFPNIPDAEKGEEWFRLLKPIIRARLKSIGFETAPLVQTLLNNSSSNNNWMMIRHLIKYCLNNADNSQAIFENISPGIAIESTGQDYIIDDMFAELRVIPYLSLIGFTSLAYHKKDSVDFTGMLKDEPYGIEVRFIRGPNFKTQLIVGLSAFSTLPIYKLCSAGLVTKLTRKQNKKTAQIQKHSMKTGFKSILFLVTNLEETDPIWLEGQQSEGKHPLQQFVDGCETPTIMLGAGLYSYTSNKLDGLVLPYDRIKYIELSKGILLR